MKKVSFFLDVVARIFQRPVFTAFSQLLFRHVGLRFILYKTHILLLKYHWSRKPNGKDKHGNYYYKGLIFSKIRLTNALISVMPSTYPADNTMTTNTRAVKIETERLPANVVESKPHRRVLLKNSRNRPKGMLNRIVHR